MVEVVGADGTGGIPLLAGALSRKAFLRTSAAALLALTLFQGRADGRETPGRARTPARAACCYGPRPLGAVAAPSPPAAPTATPPTRRHPPSPEPSVAPTPARSPQPEPGPDETPPPPPPPAPELALVEEAQDLYGAVLVLEGQDWGPDETNRLSNLRAVIEALARLPTRVVSAVGPAHRHGAVQVLSNTAGRSLLGWQPYGDFP
ncbi:MAG: hypothetical protein HYS09_10670, partial [Chloroflexi bacterium]|nr:hypothetical protein [Chloroflexota bacterium]